MSKHADDLLPAENQLALLLRALLSAISEACSSRMRRDFLGKHAVVRTKLWIKELQSGSRVPLWIRNRVHYAVLLAQAIDSGNFEEPLDKSPKQSPLPMLPRHVVARVKALVNNAREGSLLDSVLADFRAQNCEIDPSAQTETTKSAAVSSSHDDRSPRRLMFGLLCKLSGIRAHCTNIIRAVQI